MAGSLSSSPERIISKADLIPASGVLNWWEITDVTSISINFFPFFNTFFLDMLFFCNPYDFLKSCDSVYYLFYSEGDLRDHDLAGLRSVIFPAVGITIPGRAAGLFQYSFFPDFLLHRERYQRRREVPWLIDVYCTWRLPHPC